MEGVHTEWLTLLEEVQGKVALLQRKVDAGHHLQRAADDYGMLTRKPCLGYRYGQTVSKGAGFCDRSTAVKKMWSKHSSRGVIVIKSLDHRKPAAKSRNGRVFGAYGQ